MGERLSLDEGRAGPGHGTEGVDEIRNLRERQEFSWRSWCLWGLRRMVPPPLDDCHRS